MSVARVDIGGGEIANDRTGRILVDERVVQADRRWCVVDCCDVDGHRGGV